MVTKIVTRGFGRKLRIFNTTDGVRTCGPEFQKWDMTSCHRKETQVGLFRPQARRRSELQTSVPGPNNRDFTSVRYCSHFRSQSYVVQRSCFLRHTLTLRLLRKVWRHSRVQCVTSVLTLSRNIPSSVFTAVMIYIPVLHIQSWIWMKYVPPKLVPAGLLHCVITQ